MTSDDIVRAIENSHTKDVVVTECKDGPSWGGGHARMDVWTMSRSWAHPRIVGYEIKVSRGDFLKDKKWHGYLPLCNEFYFACPKDLIKAEELPAEAGLVYCTGKRLRTVKKASYRDIEIPDSLCRYLLMCRTRIVPPTYYDIAGDKSRAQKLDYWRDWLKTRKEGEDLGYEVSRHVRTYVAKVEAESHRLKRENELCADIRKMVDEMGLGLHQWDLKKRIVAAHQIFPEEFLDKLGDVSRLLLQVQKQAQEFKQPTPG